MKPHIFESPGLKAAQEELGSLLTNFMGAPVTESLVRDIEDLIEEFRSHKLHQGVPMPKMRVVALPQAGFIQIWPTEMEHADIQTRLNMLIKSLKKQRRNYDPEEIAKAIKRAYPEYVPSLLIKAN